MPTPQLPVRSLTPLDGRIAVVTGTAQGIGRGIADYLEQLGAQVTRVDRDQVDLSDTAEVQKFFAGFTSLDILINSAGGVVQQTHVPLDQVSDTDWQAVVDANLATMFQCCRAAAALMKPAGFGRIVTISSGAGRSTSLTGIQAYTASKAAQIGLTRQLAQELGPYGITVNCIAPGFVISNPTTLAQWNSYGPDGQDQLLGRIATRRTGTPADIAYGVGFFVDSDAGWISGQTLSIDGGHSLF